MSSGVQWQDVEENFYNKNSADVQKQGETIVSETRLPLSFLFGESGVQIQTEDDLWLKYKKSSEMNNLQQMKSNSK